jgi:hypothetical protein
VRLKPDYDLPPILTAEEVAEFFRTGAETIHRMERAGEGPTSASLASVVGRLPSALQATVAQIAAAGRGLYGHTSIQEIFNLNLAVFEEIYRVGAQHPDVCQLLYEINIRRKDGAQLDIGTVSSALSRARLKAAAERRGSKTGEKRSKRAKLARAVTTESGDMTPIQGSVPEQPEYGIALSLPPAPQTLPAVDRDGSQNIRPTAPATDADYGNPRDLESTASLPLTAWSPSPAARGSPTSGNLANVRNAGELLNKLRNNHD